MEFLFTGRWGGGVGAFRLGLPPSISPGGVNSTGVFRGTSSGGQVPTGSSPCSAPGGATSTGAPRCIASGGDVPTGVSLCRSPGNVTSDRVPVGVEIRPYVYIQIPNFTLWA